MSDRTEPTIAGLQRHLTRVLFGHLYGQRIHATECECPRCMEPWPRLEPITETEHEAKRETERAMHASWLMARSDPAPPSPPPPPDTVPAENYHALARERDAIRDAYNRARAELGRRAAEQRADDERATLYRAHAKCVAIHTSGLTVEVDIETDQGDRLRLHVTHDSGRAVIRAGLMVAPLLVTLTALDPNDAPPSSPATTTTTDDDDELHP